MGKLKTETEATREAKSMDNLYVCPHCSADLDEEAIILTALKELIETGESGGFIDLSWKCDTCNVALFAGNLWVSVRLDDDEPFDLGSAYE